MSWFGGSAPCVCRAAACREGKGPVGGMGQGDPGVVRLAALLSFGDVSARAELRLRQRVRISSAPSSAQGLSWGLGDKVAPGHLEASVADRALPAFQ